MSRLFIICFAIICLAICQAKLSKRFVASSNSEECTQYFVRNRANPRLYLAERKSIYEQSGHKVKTSIFPQAWCFHDDLHITSVSSGLALDLAESDLTKNQIITWPQQDPGNEPTQNQKWTHTQYYDNDGSFKIQTQVIGSEKPYLTLNRRNRDVVLRPFDLKNDYQNWYLQPV